MTEWIEEKTYLDFLFRAKSLGLKYVEFTDVVTSPTEDELKRYEELKEKFEDATGVIVNWVVAFVRTIEPVEINRGWAKDLKNLVENGHFPGIVGIDLLGDERGNSALRTGQGIYATMNGATKATMHTGELGDRRNPRDSLVMGVNRMGHGVKLQDDLIAMEYARERGVGVTCSLVSNQLLGAWPGGYRTHPFLKFLRLGIQVSLSTDDEGMFGTDISNECRVAVSNTNIQYLELIELSRNSIAQSFADEDTKTMLHDKLEADIVHFEPLFQEFLENNASVRYS